MLSRGLGSSPRVRGKQSRQGTQPGRCGLIPACAGKTLWPLTRVVWARAHPRVCGENDTITARKMHQDGSSPRVRGKQHPNPTRQQRRRLIPACAGKTLQRRSSQGRTWAHPRVCGENAERSGVLTFRSVRSWKTLSFPSSLKVTHCRAFVQLSLSRIRL